ncbi:MAG TPA: alkaline phosphatase family protein [bacterium]|nr:alkaline phosphatase family protein [bacterium]HNT64929.1 alkaline phosphatase family protein [bacterium]HOX84904.1 alkaline phosphatase family protein [bacterium]HPG44230.1 alkaline phosphatase family protein [bacterium]HPM96597.1 alkaline phosphatase family protein [bacterium]
MQNYRRSNKVEHFILIFVDGLGVGVNDSTRNPLARDSFQLLSLFQDESNPKPILHGGIAFGVDATLGVSGLPQSATGQTALLTGINTSQMLGHHLSGFPNARLRGVLQEKSLLKQLQQHGCRAAFLNTFQPPFFDHNPYDIVRYLSTTTLANLYAGLPFFTLDDLLGRRSIYQDITNEMLQAKGFAVPLFTPEEAGAIVADRAQQYDFVLFEFFQTDRAGHAQDFARAIGELRKLERFLLSLIQRIELEKTLVLITSDHGNIEDLSIKSHTRNPALTLAFGPEVDELAQLLEKLTDFVPLILSTCSR